MAELGPKDLVIFEDLPSKETPINAENLNHNFDVYNEYIKEESGKIDTALENIEESKTQMEDNINKKTTALEENITTKTNKLESDINKAREDLIIEIGKQIASISSLSILEVETLPTENISETTIYLIKPENLPSSVELGANTKVSAKSIQSTPTIKPQVFNLKGEPLYREMFVKEEQQADSKVQLSSVTAVQTDVIGIPDDEYYIACFWVRTNPDGSTHKWVAVGTTKIDLSEYAKLADLPDMNLYLTITKADETYAKKTEIPDTSGILKTLGIYDETYSTSSTYAVGDVVVHSHTLYECKTAITTGEEFNVNKWQEISLLVDE